MSVPTYNLYDFIHQVTENKFCVLYFYPYGQKNPNNLINLEHLDTISTNIPNDKLIANQVYSPQLMKKLDGTYRTWLQPTLLCNDQEPLAFDFYENIHLYERRSDFAPQKYFNIRWRFPHNIQKKWILLHSELQSTNLDKYEATGQFIGAYYWSHALLSLDWYRYAKYDNNLCVYNQGKQDFLIYARDCTKTRSYRKTFLEKVKNDCLLSKTCQIGSFHDQKVTSDSSAEYNCYDLTSTNFSVILETVFDNRIHLTEKTCRALATGHPFLLASGPKSLEYLRGYGFKTFDPWIDESYDNELDNETRLEKIVQSMKKFSLLPKDQQRYTIEKCKEIANYNKNLFWSDDFFEQCVAELKHNVQIAYNQVKADMFDVDRFFENLKWKQDMHIEKQEEWRVKRAKFDLNFFNYLKKGGTLEDYVPPDLD